MLYVSQEKIQRITIIIDVLIEVYATDCNPSMAKEAWLRFKYCKSELLIK